MAFQKNEALVGIHNSFLSGMLCNHASYTGRVFYLQCLQQGIFLAQARHIILLSLFLPLKVTI